MKPSRRRSSTILVLGGALLAAPAARGAVKLELYGNFHAMGVIVDLGANDDPSRNASATVEYRQAGSPAYRPAFSPSRVSDTRIVTSLFWLIPGTSYDVRVTLADPDGPPLDGQVLTATAATRADVVVPAALRTLHVDPVGSGTTCSAAAPCALPQAVGMSKAGDELLLHSGIYYQGGLNLQRSGNAAAPIVIRAAPGETPVLDGADPGSFAWTDLGGGVYHTTLNVAGPNLVLSNGERLYPYATLADLQGLSWGIPGFFDSGTDLYVRLAGDADPAAQALVISRENLAFSVGVDFIYFIDLTFRHYGLKPYPKAIYLNGASDCLVQGSTFAINDLGIGIKRASHRNLIQDNQFHDTTYLWPWDGVKAGSSLETGGVIFYGPTSGRGTVIRRNTFHDFFDGFGSCPDDNGGVTNETDVYENQVYNTGDDGLSADGACSNVRIWRNRFRNVLVGVSFAPVTVGPVYALRNLIYQTGAGNNNYTGNCFKFNNGYPQSSGPVYLLHTTCDAVKAATPAESLFSPGFADRIDSRNNIWSGTGTAINNANASFVADLDWDDLYTTGTNLVRWLGTNYPTLSGFQAAIGQEPKALNVAPGFADAAGGDYTLAATSAVIDRGTPLPGIDDDFVGAAPDLGAFESVPAAACDLMYGDVTFPPVTPAKVAPWVYADRCPAGDDRLGILLASPAPPGDLPDAVSGAGGGMRLYQVGCTCTNRIGLVKNPATGRVSLVYF